MARATTAVLEEAGASEEAMLKCGQGGQALFGSHPSESELPVPPANAGHLKPSMSSKLEVTQCLWSQVFLIGMKRAYLKNVLVQMRRQLRNSGGQGRQAAYCHL